jgi:hypothetical protein
VEAGAGRDQAGDAAAGQHLPESGRMTPLTIFSKVLLPGRSGPSADRLSLVDGERDVGDGRNESESSCCRIIATLIC